jgi:GntR family transcriptional regulator
LSSDSVLPLYYQLKETLRSDLLGGRWQPGEAFPSEAELCSQYQVSRATVRQALSALVIEGLLLRKQGRGTFVGQPKIQEDLLGFYNLSQQLSTKGIATSSQVVAKRAIPVPPLLGRVFDLSEGALVHEIIRLRFAGGDPLLLEWTYVPDRYCPDFSREDLNSTPVFFNLLVGRYGLVLKGAKKWIEPIASSQYEAELLQIRKGSPALLIDRHTYDDRGRVVVVGKWVVRGDRCRHYVDAWNS